MGVSTHRGVVCMLEVCCSKRGQHWILVLMTKKSKAARPEPLVILPLLSRDCLLVEWLQEAKGSWTRLMRAANGVAKMDHHLVSSPRRRPD